MEMSTKSVQKNITVRLAERLASRGFRKIKGNDYTIVGLWNEAEAQIRCAVRKDGMSGVNLVSLHLGIRFAAMQKLLPSSAYAESNAPTIATQISSLHADRRLAEWDAEKPDIMDTLQREIEK